MKTRQVHLNMPEKLVDKADVAAKVLFKNRTEIVKEALYRYLNELEVQDELKEKAVEKYLGGEIEFDALEAFIGKQDAEAVRTSREIYDHGDELAAGIADQLKNASRV